MSAPLKALEWLAKAEARLSEEVCAEVGRSSEVSQVNSVKQQKESEVLNDTRTVSTTVDTRIIGTSNESGNATSKQPAVCGISSTSGSRTNSSGQGIDTTIGNIGTKQSGQDYFSRRVSELENAGTEHGDIEIETASPREQYREGGDTSKPTQSELGLRVGERQQTLDSIQGLKQPSYSKLEFSNPAEMYAFFNADILAGRKNFHKWQVEENIRVAGNYTQDEPLKLVLCACNGSGKDSFFISPVSVWLAACKIRHRVIISSSSYNQLATQTEAYITAYCRRVNEVLGFEVFDIKQGHIKCNVTGSEIKMFVTDEPGKAEGYHPFDDYLGAEMTIILNESKSIKPAIFQAFARCTGYSRWLEVSSPGKTSGHLYEAYCMGVPYPMVYVKGKWFTRKVTINDCPHISRNQIEDDKVLCGGETSEFYRSKYLAEFTNIEDRVVVGIDKINECLLNPPKWNGELEVRGGLDLSGGRDETVTSSRQGNRLNKIGSVRITDATLLVAYLDAIEFPNHHFVKEQTKIFTDAGGMGEPIIDMLKALKWNIISVHNQAKATNNKLYKNKGTNNWFNFGNAVKLRDVILISDEKFKSQLSKRHYDLPDNDKIALVSKKEEKANGNDSPDRADSVVLAFTGYKVVTSRKLDEVKRAKIKGSESITNITQSELVQHMMDKRFKQFEGESLVKARGGRTPSKPDEFFSQRSYIEGLIKLNNAKN